MANINSLRMRLNPKKRKRKKSNLIVVDIVPRSVSKTFHINDNIMIRRPILIMYFWLNFEAPSNQENHVTPKTEFKKA